MPGTQQALNKCWLVMGSQRRCHWQESIRSVPGLQEHKQRQGLPGQTDSAWIMGVALRGGRGDENHREDWELTTCVEHPIPTWPELLGKDDSHWVTDCVKLGISVKFLPKCQDTPLLLCSAAGWGGSTDVPTKKTRAHLDAEPEATHGFPVSWWTTALCAHVTGHGGGGARPHQTQSWPSRSTVWGAMGQPRAVTTHGGRAMTVGVQAGAQRGFSDSGVLRGRGGSCGSAPVAMETHSC